LQERPGKNLYEESGERRETRTLSLHKTIGSWKGYAIQFFSVFRNFPKDGKFDWERRLEANIYSSLERRISRRLPLRFDKLAWRLFFQTAEAEIAFKAVRVRRA